MPLPGLTKPNSRTILRRTRCLNRQRFAIIANAFLLAAITFFLAPLAQAQKVNNAKVTADNSTGVPLPPTNPRRPDKEQENETEKEKASNPDEPETSKQPASEQQTTGKPAPATAASKGTTAQRPTKPPKKQPITAPKHGALLLYEPANGNVLYAHNIDRQTYPASLTKMMTAYLVFEAAANGEIKLDDNITFSEHARAQPATRVGLRKGIDVTYDTAVRALIIRSANDFAVAIAESISGTEAAFIDRMNATARRLGMSRTNFTNPHGLPNASQVSTTRDMALLTSALIRDFPQHADVFKNQAVKIRKLELRTHNSLLRTYYGADGMKTGFTCSSGYNIVASATRDGRRLAAVVIGALTRAKRDRLAAQALDQGFLMLAESTRMPRAALASIAITGNDSDPTLDLARKTRTWVCGNGHKPRKYKKKKRKKKFRKGKKKKKKSKKKKKKKN